MTPPDAGPGLDGAPAPDAGPEPGPDAGPGPRAALAAAQEALLAALVAGGEPPPGFDPERLRVQSRALLAKRGRQAAAHHAWLVQALPVGDYRAHFADYAAAHPLRAGSHADAVAFERYLQARGLLPRAARPRWWRVSRRRAG